MRSLLAPLAAVLVVGGAAAATDDDVILEAGPEAGGMRQPHLIDLGANFDANLFEQRGGWVLRNEAGPEPTIPRASPALERARDLGRKRIDRMAAACTLTEEQQRRLALAVESDARRFAHEVEAVRSPYIGRQIDMNDQAGQKAWHAFQQDVTTCRDRLRNVFDVGSLFAVTTASVLDERQAACLAAENAARRSFQWRAMVLEAIAKFDESLGLDQRQHDALVAEVLAHEPPLRNDPQALGRADSNMRRHLVLMVMAELDAKPLRAAVNERQWQVLSLQINQGRAMRSAIEAQGFLERPR
ncbi:MAG: hypothetical protein ACKO1M_00715 [Planctomycetota bacterium]